ncbi:MAG: AmmeMemoRadiSam system protein B [Candidatus Omnitrophica bacterium]|nr:AmmeMemoRadiSam system protein B [Candidatus Omnitrophota bacterium]
MDEFAGRSRCPAVLPGGDRMTRQPAVAGQFYPSDKKTLLDDISSMMTGNPEKIDAIGVVSPHAGYVYSGPVAAEVFSGIEPAPVYVILSPNHTGSGERFAVSGQDWHTPLGTLRSEQGLIRELCANTGLASVDENAHLYEHSVEVQLPFIQAVSPEARIVPVTISHAGKEEIKEFASALADSVSGHGEKVIIVASSDMTHYESRESASIKDGKAIEKILALDPEGLMETVGSESISMCGYLPVALMLMYAKRMGAKNASLVKYTDSGEATGDTSQVVGYAGIVVY